MNTRRSASTSNKQTETRIWIVAADGPPHELDVTELVKGRTIDDVPSRSRKSWAGDFHGRPELAFEILELWKERRISRADVAHELAAARTLFRFLDYIDASCGIINSDGFLDSHGTDLLKWSTDTGRSYIDYRRIKSIVYGVRQRSSSSSLFWPARPKDIEVHKDDIDFIGFERLFIALKKEGMAIKDMFREGEALAAAGGDPRGDAGSSGSAAWEFRENHAWLIKTLTEDQLLYKDEIYRRGGHGLNKANRPEQHHIGPCYLAPGMTDRGSEGIVGKLRWFHPSYHDTAVFFWMFLLNSGWNLSTALAVDLSEDWSEPHPQQNGYSVIHAYKRRSARYQYMVSNEKPQWHPYRILCFMEQRTQVMRRTIKYRLRDAVTAAGSNPSPGQIAEIERLTAISKSPWLYHVVNKVGEINCFDNSDAGQLNSIIRLVAERYSLGDEHPSLLSIGTGESRDAWIGHAYSGSNNNVLIARLAAQHVDMRELVKYLRRRRYRTQSEKIIRKVQDIIFTDIVEKNILDPTRLRIKVQTGTITSEQEARLLDYRKRTRLGMGCLEPDNPPREVDPNYRRGTLCSVQRCTGCSHGIVFKESLEPLARARAELIFLKRTLPLSAWIGSSFEKEADSIDATLKLFDPDDVSKTTNRWLEKFIAEEAFPHDTYPVR